MKKFIAAMLFTVSTNSFAAGPYDGIWSIDPYGYVTISEKDGVMIAVINWTDTYSGYWMAYSGTRVDNKVELRSLNVPDNYTGVDVILNATNNIRFYFHSKADILHAIKRMGWMCS